MRATIRNPGEELVELDILETRAVRAGARLAVYRSGGYGAPETHSRELVGRDIEDGYISARHTREVYGLNNP